MATLHIGPLVNDTLANTEVPTFWTIRLDVGAVTSRFPPEEDTRNILYGSKTSVADDDIMEDHLEMLGHAIPPEKMATTNIRVVGTIILHTEM